MAWDALLRGVQSGVENFTRLQQQKADEEQRKKDQAFRDLQMKLLQSQETRSQAEADRIAAENAPGTPEVPGITQDITQTIPLAANAFAPGTTSITTGSKPATSGGINYQKAQADIATSQAQKNLMDAQTKALGQKGEPSGTESFKAYDRDILLYKTDPNTGQLIRKSNDEINAELADARSTWLTANLGTKNKEKPPITEKEALIFDKNGKAIYARGEIMGPTLDDAASKAGAGYNWSTLKADINSGKLKGNDLDKVYTNMARTLLGAITMTDPSRRDEYTAAIKNYLKDVANAPEPAAPKASVKPTNLGEALATTNPTTPSGIEPDSMEPGIWRLAKALRSLGTTSDADKAALDDIIQNVEQPGLVQSAPFLMEQLKKIARRNNYTGPSQ